MASGQQAGAIPPGAATQPAADAAERQRRLREQHRRPPQWWKQRPAYRCPACGQSCYRVPAFQSHILRCCPDVALPAEWHALLAGAEAQAQPQQAQQAQQAGSEGQQAPAAHPADAAIRAWLVTVGEREAALRERALDIAFRQRDAAGEPLRQGPAEVVAALGLPAPRAAALLRAAMRAVPLAADGGHPVEVLYEDADVVAVNKPAGLITAPKHRYTGGSLVNRIIGTLGFEPLTLHRLDMNTTGVVLFARARDVVDGVHGQFRRKTVRKEYLALAVGVPPQRRFTVDAPIDRADDDVVARRVVQGGKPAVTDFTVLATAPAASLAGAAPAPRADAALRAALAGGGLSLVACAPLTGRTHQIRVHLAHAGYAILGDDLYGATGPWIGRHALHAARLTLAHPRSGEPLSVRAPLPPDFLEAMARLGLAPPPDWLCGGPDGGGSGPGAGGGAGGAGGGGQAASPGAESG